MKPALGGVVQRIVELGELELGRHVAGLGGAAEHQEGRAHLARLGVVTRLGEHRLGRGLGREKYSPTMSRTDLPGALAAGTGAGAGVGAGVAAATTGSGFWK